jgi:hypothetical protein
VVDSILTPTVSAILSTLLAPTDTSAHQDRMAAEMMIKLKGMPRYMGVGVMGLTLAFDGEATARGGRRFHQLDPEARAAQVARWKASRIPLRRMVLEVYEKMGTFIYYSLVEEAEGHA